MQFMKYVKLTANKFKTNSYNVDFDCPVGNVTINGSQTLRNKKPACCEGPIGIVLIIGKVCVGVETENKMSTNQTN